MIQYSGIYESSQLTKKSKRKKSQRNSSEETTMKNPIHHGTDAESEGNAIYFPVVCTFFHQLILWPSYNPASHPSSG